jgi:hypothetical protein
MGQATQPKKSLRIAPPATTVSDWSGPKTGKEKVEHRIWQPRSRAARFCCLPTPIREQNRTYWSESRRILATPASDWWPQWCSCEDLMELYPGARERIGDSKCGCGKWNPTLEFWLQPAGLPLLFRPIPLRFGDDCIVPLDVRLQGFKILQDPDALVSDEMPHSVEGELRARIRMTTRNWSGTLSRPGSLNPLHFCGTAWGLISHKFLRWLTPFSLAIALLTNGLLVAGPKWALLLLIQVLFYAAAVIGWRRSRWQPCERIFGYPFAFCLANLGFLLGVVRSLRGQAVIAYK